MQILRKALAPLVVLIGSAAILTAANAHAGVAHHERVEIKEITKDKKVVGLKVKLLIKPESYERVRIGINAAGAQASNHREAASDASKGHLLHQFAEVALDGTTAKPVELEVLYKDNPKLKPGESFEIVSAYNKKSNATYWHVYGMTGAGGTPDKYTMPGKAAAQRKSIVKDIRRAGKRTAKRRPRRQAKRPTTRQRAKRKAPRKPARRAAKR